MDMMPMKTENETRSEDAGSGLLRLTRGLARGWLARLAFALFLAPAFGCEGRGNGEGIEVLRQAATSQQCGNGHRQGAEECDDGNKLAGDGCSASCIVEAPVEPSVDACGGAYCAPARCGDGVVAPSEQCDDRNGANGDGCGASCQLEPGASCPTAGSVCSFPSCGNGALEPGEGCDDRNAVAGDGCGSNCQVEPGASCPTVGASCVTASCAGLCGGSAGSCFCDEACSDYGDCCGDKVAVCGG